MVMPSTASGLASIAGKRVVIGAVVADENARRRRTCASQLRERRQDVLALVVDGDDDVEPLHHARRKPLLSPVAKLRNWADVISA